MELRPYQQDAVDAVLREYDAGVHRQLLVMPTGSGKTVVFSLLYDALNTRLPGQMLVLAHREELIDQSISTLRAANPALTVDKEMAGYHADPTADIIVASVATLGRKGTTRPEKFSWDNFTKVVVDEAHHSTAQSYQNVFQLFIGKPLIIGVTATPSRTDGVDLSSIYEKISYSYSIRQAVEDGWLAKPRGYRVTTATQLDEVKSSGGDFVQSELSKEVNSQERNQFIVAGWKNHAEKRKTIVFAVDIQHAQDLAEEFNRAGVSAKAVWGDDPQRSEKLQEHKDGTYPVLVNVGIALEGYDDPTIACVVVARPTESSLVFQQAVGRGLRTAPGKTDCIVLDIWDNCSRHSLITLPTLMGLSNQLDLKGHELLATVEEIENLQADNPTIDFSKMLSVDELKTIVETVNMFEVRFPKETEENSEFIWYRAIGGGFKILIPKDGPEKAGYMKISENQLGQWEIEGRIKDVELAATRLSMEESFKASDEQIRKRLGKMRLSYLLREATWHNKPVTRGQKQMLTRLFPHKTFAWHLMSSGQASKLISERISRRVK